MVYNFSVGSAMISPHVMREVQKEFLDYRGIGKSVMELNHRSLMFNEIIDDAKQTLKDLMSIPDNYHILFLQSGASSQFAAIPMNLMKKHKVGFVMIGHWTKRAFEEASMYG